MKKLNPRHETFIREMIEHGNATRAYAVAYSCPPNGSARTGASRLMKNAAISHRIEEALRLSLDEIKTAQVKESREMLSSIAGIRKSLADLISGEKKFSKLYKMGGTVVPVAAEPSPGDILHALDINIKLLKMSAEKHKQTGEVLTQHS